MTELMQRRRALMAQKPSGEQWDYVWNYTDGLPDANGATLVTSGNYTIQMSGDGLEISAGIGYVAYRFPNYQSSLGKMRVEFVADNAIGIGQYIRVCYSNGGTGVQTSANNGTVTPINQSSPSAILNLGQINTIQVELRGSSCAFFVNDVLVGENLQNSGYYANNTQVMIQATGTSKVILRSIKIRKE